MSVQIPCGEWLNGSRTYCEEGHLCETCSEITILRKQLADMQDAKEKLDAIREYRMDFCYDGRHSIWYPPGTLPVSGLHIPKPSFHLVARFIWGTVDAESVRVVKSEDPS